MKIQVTVIAMMGKFTTQSRERSAMHGRITGRIHCLKATCVGIQTRVWMPHGVLWERRGRNAL